MNLHKEVERAIENAPTFDEYPHTTNDFSRYKDMPDDFYIRQNQHDEVKQNVVYIEADEGHGLAAIFEAFGDVYGEKEDSDYIDYAVRHEGQHYAAARMLGATSARYGVRFLFAPKQKGVKTLDLWRNPLFIVRDLQTTKLGTALINAYPIDPSKGDIMDVKSIGYSGVESLAEIAIARNMGRKNGDRFYPVPLSVMTEGVDLDSGQRITPEAVMLELAMA